VGADQRAQQVARPGIVAPVQDLTIGVDDGGDVVPEAAGAFLVRVRYVGLVQTARLGHWPGHLFPALAVAAHAAMDFQDADAVRAGTVGEEGAPVWDDVQRRPSVLPPFGAAEPVEPAGALQ